MSVTPDRQLTWIDKQGWGPGPWQGEPDKIQWVDPATDLDCLAVRHPQYGHWCGYVGVPEGHPLFGLGYDDAEDKLMGSDVHGGLTFAATCQDEEDPEERERGICHVPLPGRPEKVFWFGFDAAHAWDYQPAKPSLFQSLGLPSLTYDRDPYAVYRTLEYVREECVHLARKLRAIAG